MSEGDELLYRMVAQDRPEVRVVDLTVFALRVATTREHTRPFGMRWRYRGRTRAVRPTYHVTVFSSPRYTSGSHVVMVTRESMGGRSVHRLYVPEPLVRATMRRTMTMEDVQEVWTFVKDYLPYRTDLASHYEHAGTHALAAELPDPRVLLSARRAPSSRCPGGGKHGLDRCGSILSHE